MQIEVVTEIRAIFVISDNGYTRDMSLPEIEEWARRKLNNVTILTQDGTQTPKPVTAPVKELVKVIFTPDKEPKR